MIRPRITETIAALGRAVKSAGLGFDGVDRILLVGGSSRIPLVAEMVRESTGRPIAVDAHPKHSMALGAAFVAEQRRLAAQADSEAAAARPRLRRAPGRSWRWRRPPPRTSQVGRRGRCGYRGGAGGAVAAGAAVAGVAAAGCRSWCRGRRGRGRRRRRRRRRGRWIRRGLPPGSPVETAGGGAFPPTEVVPVVGAGTAVTAAAGGGSNRNRMIAAAAAVGGIAVVLLLGIGASGMLSGGGAVEPAARRSPSSAPRRRSRPRSRRPRPPPRSRPRPPSRRPTAVPTPTPTPAGRQARITGIAVTDGRYVVDYEVFGYTPALPGRHVHFFFDTVSVADAGVPGKGPWFLYAGPVPFTRLQGQRPARRRGPDVHPRRQLEPFHRREQRQLHGSALAHGWTPRWARATWPRRSGASGPRRCASHAGRTRGGGGRPGDAPARRAVAGGDRRPGQGRQVDAPQRARRRATGGDRRRRVHPGRDLVPQRARLQGRRRPRGRRLARPRVPP